MRLSLGRRAGSAAGFAWMLSFACQANLLEPAADEGPVSGRTPGGSNGSNGGGGSLTCETGPSPIRRLSQFELRATLESVFPDVPLPPLDLPTDQAPFGFDNDHSALRSNSIFVEAQLGLASELAASRASTALAAADCVNLDDAACARRFVEHWGRRLFRRPIEPEIVDAVAALFDGEVTREQGATLALQTLLSMPEFLYHIDLTTEPIVGPGDYPLDPHSLASRLSYALWGAPPDDALVAAALEGRLATEEGIRVEASRMLEDPRARRGVRHFFGQWLDLGRLDRTTKLPEDGFTSEVRESMREETLRFVEALVFDRDGTIRDLLTADWTIINRTLAGLYGVEVPAEAPEWFEVSIPDRRGVLTQASVLASHSHPTNKSPVLRGHFVIDKVLCLQLGSPPANAESNQVEGSDGLRTNRERYDAVTMTSDNCAFCHVVINNAGYAFESFDTMGRFVRDEGGIPIDPSGDLLGLQYDGAVGLAEGLGSDPEFIPCASGEFLRYVFGGAPAGLDPCVLDAVVSDVVARGGSLRELILSAVSHPEFRTLRLDPAPRGS